MINGQKIIIQLYLQIEINNVSLGVQGTTLSISLYLEDTDETEGIYEMRVVGQNVQQLKIEAAKYEKRNESILETVSNFTRYFLFKGKVK